MKIIAHRGLVNGPDKNKENSPSQFEWKRAGKTSLIWISVILFAVYVSGVLTESSKKEVEIEYTEYKDTSKTKILIKALSLVTYFMENLNCLNLLKPPLVCSII